MADLRPFGVEITGDEVLGEFAHVECGECRVAPDDRPVVRDRGSRVQLHHPPRERAQVFGCILAARGLVEPPFADHHQRIAAEYRPFALHRQRLGLGQRERDLIGPRAFERGFERALVDRRGPRLERDPRRLQHRRARGTLGGENDHIGFDPSKVSLAPSRSPIRRITAAAVSSIERRVTSITGQPLSANNRRAKATSRSTLSSST